MSNLTDRVSYIKGLAEGLKLDTEKNEGKLIEKMLELLSDMAVEMDELRHDHDDLDEYVESIDSDLSELEDMIYGDEEDDETVSQFTNLKFGTDYNIEDDEDNE